MLVLTVMRYDRSPPRRRRPPFSTTPAPAPRCRLAYPAPRCRLLSSSYASSPPSSSSRTSSTSSSSSMSDFPPPAAGYEAALLDLQWCWPYRAPGCPHPPFATSGREDDLVVPLSRLLLMAVRPELLSPASSVDHFLEVLILQDTCSGRRPHPGATPAGHNSKLLLLPGYCT